MTDGEWAEVAAALAAYPGDFSVRDARVYRTLLDGISHEEAMGAIRRHVRTGERWRPSPGEIVTLAGRAVRLPPFGMVRAILQDACETPGVRLARDSDVTGALVGEIDNNLPVALYDLVTKYVAVVGGRRIRAAAIYVGDERAWHSLGRDYEGMASLLQDHVFDSLGDGSHPALEA